VAELDRDPQTFETTLVHTGQHYDDKLSRVFFDDLGIRRPDVNLEVGSGSHAQQTAAIIAAFEPALIERQADLVLVVGDVNSTLACALVAAKLTVPVAHVEAGLRSFDRSMPEEINRVLTDQISDLLFTTDAVATGHLSREGIDPAKVHFVGNVMIDTLLAHRDRARTLNVLDKFDVRRQEYVMLTLHRPSNVDDRQSFERLFDAIAVIAQEKPVLFPVHPRTRPAVEQSPVTSRLVADGRLRLTEPLGYLEFIALVEHCRAVLTDSGGVQEESTILGVPCLTLRANTERPVTVSHGTNRLVGTDTAAILGAWRAIHEGPRPVASTPPLWDGRASSRIVHVLKDYAAGAVAPPTS
jgi:UDP-N-acetylglucosamine 2-epimerase (non-hydrolysing)